MAGSLLNAGKQARRYWRNQHGRRQQRS